MNPFRDPNSTLHWKRLARTWAVYWMFIWWGRHIDMELLPRIIVAIIVSEGFDYWWRHRNDDDNRRKRKRRIAKLKHEWARFWTWLQPAPQPS